MGYAHMNSFLKVRSKLFPFRSQSPIHGDFDVLLMGDMLYDEDIGSKVTQLAGTFRGLALVGDPGKVID